MHEVIFKGATRPALKFGVPVVPLVLIVVGALIGALWGTFFFGVGAAFPILAGAGGLLVWMRSMTRKDDQRLNQFFLKTRLLILARGNRDFWQCRSYSPYSHRGAKTRHEH
jgi:type IV secretion system protein VirB3